MGINDPAAVLLIAENPETHEYYAYKEFYKRDQVISQVGHAIKTMIADIPQGMLHTPLIDPSANKRSNISGKTYKQQMAVEFDLIFKDANNRIVDGIAKTRDMFYNNKLWIFKSLKDTIREGCEYRYPTPEERNKNRNLGDTPLDKDNHLMDCLRYICQEIPYNFLNLDRASYSGVKKFFENMGINMSVDRTHSTPKSFDNFAVNVAKRLNMGNYVKTGRASGGFKI